MVGLLTFELSPCVSKTFMSVSRLWHGHVRAYIFVEFEKIKPSLSMRTLTKIVSC